MKQLAIILLTGLLFFTIITCRNEQRQKVVFTLGISHESNTFASFLTKESEFDVLRGEDAVKGQAWSEVFKKAGIRIIPSLHAHAQPGGVVERSAYEHFRDEIIKSLNDAGKVDGIYMDMHGALHVDGYDDAQADLIGEIRKIAGDDVLISGSFDLHGNPSPEFISQINMLTAYRTAPHRDGSETRARAAQMLVDAMINGWKPYIKCIAIPILVPGEKSITEVEPLKPIYEQIPGIAKIEGLMDCSIFAGYCWADLPRSSMRVFVVARDKKYSLTADKEAATLAKHIWDIRKKLELDVPSGSIGEMLAKAKEYPENTVFISDSGDNTTAGAPGDNTQVLGALIKNKAKGAVMAGIVDPEALRKCQLAGTGKKINLDLGGRIDNVFGKSLNVDAEISFLSPDSIMNTDRGVAVIETGGVKTVILKTRRSFTELRDFREAGLNPLDFKIVVVKLGYLFPELRDIAPIHLMALTSGFCNLDIKSLPYKNITRPSYPVDPDMEWAVN